MKEKEDIVFDVLESTGNFNGKKPYKCWLNKSSHNLVVNWRLYIFCN